MAVQKNFVIQNGLEVNNDLILADKDSNKVGIGTTNPLYTLHVNGGIGATTLTVTGVSTVSDLIIGGKVGIGSSFGAAGQYLVSTGTGVTWGAIPTVRTTDLKTAGVGATTFNTTYAVGLLDVYINGVKLSSDEYTANNGATVVLDDACFGGETVEFISYSPFGIGVGGTSIQGITILEEGSPVGSAAQVTSINFVGAAVTAVGSGFGVTVFANSNPNYWGATAAGIHTLSRVGIGTTNPIAPIHISNGNGGISTALYTSDYLVISGVNTSPAINLIASGNSTDLLRGVFKGTRSRGTLSSPTVPLVNDDTVSLLGAIYDGSTNQATAAIHMEVDGTVSIGTAPQRITFWTGIGTSRLERVRVTSGGNVGIGTTNPSGTLQVGSATSTFIVTGIGSVGIGTTNPATQLHIQSTQPTIRFNETDATANNRNWNVTTWNQEFYWQGLDDSGVGGNNLFAITRSGNQIQTFEGRNAGTTWFEIDNSTQRVGIGTSIPRFPLEVGAVGASGTTLYVNGNARVVGILTVGSSSVTLDGEENQINVGTGVTIHHTNGVQVGENTVHSSGITLNNLNVSGVTTSQGGFTSGIGVTDPVQITVSGNVLTFNVVGVGSTSLTLY